jgi:hypothetical protein
MHPIVTQNHGPIIKTCILLDGRCEECGGRVESIREHLTDDGHCLISAYRRATRPAPLAKWSEDDGAVLWWAFHYGMPYEAPYVGTPLDTDWPGYHTHWTRLPDVLLSPRGTE